MRARASPGETLPQEVMTPLGLSGNELARRLEVPPDRIDGIVRNRRAISAGTALRLAHYFGTTAQFWLNAGTAHPLSKRHRVP